MKTFFKNSLTVVVGIFIYTTIMGILGGIFMIIVIAAASSGDKVEVKNNSILHVELNLPIEDRASDNFMENLDFMSMSQEEYIGLNDILKSIKKAETDDRIKGIYLELTEIQAGMPAVEEIRNAIIKFKESGKFVVAYANYYSHKSYYLSSVADKIYMTPSGHFTFTGFSIQSMFFKNALDKMGVKAQIIRHGKFKSAVEPFILEEMSDANRKQMETYLFAVWNDFAEKISLSRGISTNDLNRYADSLEISSSQSSVDKKLVDALMYQDEITKELKSRVEISSNKKLRLVKLSSYIDALSDEKINVNNDEDKIAIIYAIGEIGMGEGSTYEIGSDGMSKAIRKARKDSSVKAIVLRIDSPGGSALASEIIWREVVLAKEVKPVVVSMGQYAASGGYYIACPADKIIASPNTLTGSIGVFGMYPNVQDLLNNKIGINVSTVKTNEYSDMPAFTRPLSQTEKDYLQLFVEDIYGVFIEHVAEGRNMTVAQVDSIGQGRIWSGINAIEIGLVDELGGLDRAIEVAEELANVSDYQIIELPKIKDTFEQILEGFSTKMETMVMKKTLGQSYEYYMQLNEISKMQGVQARMMFNIDIN